MEESKFYESHPRSEAYLNKYWKKLFCYDEQINIQGDYQSDRATQLMIHIVKCNNETRGEGEPPCKSDQEIEGWLRRKFLLTLTNQKRFEPENYDHDEMIIDVSHLKWYPIQSNLRKEIVNEI